MKSQACNLVKGQVDRSFTVQSRVHTQPSVGEGPQQVGTKAPKSIKDRGNGKQRTNSKKQANCQERGRRAVSSELTDMEESASDIRIVRDCLEKSNRRERAIPLREGDTAEPKPE